MRPRPPNASDEFLRKRDQWIRCLASDDINSILSQVYSLIWNAASFRVVNEARLLAPRGPDGNLRVNRLMHVLLDRCFLESQAVAVRRQLDTYPLDGRKGAFSLRGLVEDLSEHRGMLTRANHFGAARLPMDWEAALAYEQELFRPAAAGQAGATWGDPECDPGRIQELHSDFDELAQVSSDKRSANDVVAEAVFDGLRMRLASIERFVEPVNKLLAHAAIPESRALAPPGELSIKLADLWHAHEVICRTCQFIDAYLLRQTSHVFLAITQCDLFVHLETPLAPEETKGRLRDEWSKYERETETWRTTTHIDWPFESKSESERRP